MLFEVMKAEKRLEKDNEDLQRRLQQKTDEVERLQTEVEQKEDRKKRLREIMADEDARHAKSMRETQDGTKEKRDEQARKEAAGKGFVEGTTVYLKDGGYSSCSTREFTVEYCILAISDNQGEVWADVQTNASLTRTWIMGL